MAIIEPAPEGGGTGRERGEQEGIGSDVRGSGSEQYEAILKIPADDEAGRGTIPG